MEMTDVLLIVALAVFLACSGANAVYGLHVTVLACLFAWKQRRVRATQRSTIAGVLAADGRENWPVVTTQLPIYNEIDVAARLIHAVARQDYSRDKHEIQVLDDSTDATRDVVDRLVREYTGQGVDIKVIRRPNRDGYKAGALAHATPLARGEFLAILDADFVPGPGFVKECVALIKRDERIACVQGRWGHLNRDESWLTRAQSLGLDVHFTIEQGARAWGGLLMNFNGTAGLWRKSAILDEAVGGWSADTLTEDLDLSYRVQLAGWKIEYCMDITCPAELPGTVAAFKSQQRRWATGSIQVARKMLPRVWKSSLKLRQKLEATLHLTHYAVSLFMLLTALVSGPMLCIWLQGDYLRPWFFVGWSGVCFTAMLPLAVYAFARYVLGEGWGSVRLIPGMLILGTGMSLNNALAALRGLYMRGGEFVRTPKSGNASRNRISSRYATRHSHLWIGEIGMAAYSALVLSAYLWADRHVTSVFLLIYTVGFLLIGWASRPSALPHGGAKQIRQEAIEVELEGLVGASK